MILKSLCNSCLQPFEILMQESDIGLVKQVSEESGQLAPCPRKCGGKINLVGDPIISTMTGDPRLKQPMRITGRQLYQAVNGMGLPDELPRSIDMIESLLLAHKITGLDIQADGDRFYLHEIRLSNGSIIHLSTGLKGAQILKITKEFKNGQ